MKIICIGRNYLNHAKELGNSISNEPLFFLKPETAIQPKGHPFFIPDFSDNIHYEVELVVRINKSGKHIAEKFAHKYYSKIGLGIDFTARDIQEECKAKGLPWEKAKGFDGSAQLSRTFIDKSKLELDNIPFRLEKNGEQVQIGNSKDMLFNFDKIISYLSQFYTLKIGDLIYTGTPEGVGKVIAGETLKGFITDKEMFKVVVK
ncbi:MAG: fumarylacetoacetate hydrolase family protein [Flavobacteriales bacterium]|jgi:2-keto-4-pentenoate hydratase/2-oxohepta-3-ene-1,7-dioic acid hydratase in catechol pathway|nr:fumarylacetoacetate hydrolase family protein [Flavobacteriales bacterium]MBT6013776.1 fumarylacetoacetate hydrolase family protein [Flavobacteriales bacterium]MBT7480986.1 fumarylacetoacetate hydrolase family protein [Flavobacteriales bacterium]